MVKTNQILNRCVNADLLWLRRRFQEAGFDIRIVGGAVRDILREFTPKDIDLCTDAYPDEAITIYKKHNIRFELTGIDHGTISVIMNGEVYEITSLRFDTETDGRHAKVTFTRDWKEDLARRDLTINAMSMSFDGELEDPFDGQGDLQAGIVRFVGNPEDRIQEDYLRILRYFRFAGRFARTIENEDQMAAIRKHVEGLRRVSRERVWQEVSKILLHPAAAEVYEAMASCGVLEHSDLPPFTLEARKPLRRAAHFAASTEISHGDTVIKTHAATVFATLITCDADAVSYAKNLRMSSYESKLIRDIASFDHGYYGQSSEYFKELEKKIVLNNWSIETCVQVAIAGGNTHIAYEILDATWEKFPITGDDLIADGHLPGKSLGQILMRLKVAWFNSNYQLDKPKLIYLASQYAKEAA